MIMSSVKCGKFQFIADSHTLCSEYRLAKMFVLSAVVFWMVSAYVECGNSSKPHIVIIYADDLGWNDVSFHGSPEIPTPNIDALALSGLALDRYYGSWLCTPSRGALMTGQYPTELGFQHEVILQGEMSGLSLEKKTMADHLKKLGYSTHIVGKWHLGYMTKEYTPTYRGFDSFFGYYGGLIDYYDYTSTSTTRSTEVPLFYGVDLQNGTTPILNLRGKYATHMFTDEAIRIIENHDESQPLFLYFSHLAVHAGNMGASSVEQAPPEDIYKFRYIEDYNRRIHAARVSALDDSVGAVFESLYKKGMLQNAIIVFASDNGGQANGFSNGYSTNYPLRGQKFTVFEGGVRVPGVVWSPLLGLKETRISTQLMHVTDWLPTLYSAVDGDIRDLGSINGLDMWSALCNDSPSPRTEMLHIIDPISNTSSLMKDDMKVLSGNATAAVLDGWSGPTGFEYISKPSSMNEWVFQKGSKVKDIVEEMGMWRVKDADEWYASLVTDCKQQQSNGTKCDPWEKPCLFNIKEDPCEYNNLAEKLPKTVDSLMKLIEGYAATAMPPQAKKCEMKANPSCYNFTYVPFYNTEAFNSCPL